MGKLLDSNIAVGNVVVVGNVVDVVVVDVNTVVASAAAAVVFARCARISDPVANRSQRTVPVFFCSCIRTGKAWCCGCSAPAARAEDCMLFRFYPPHDVYILEARAPDSSALCRTRSR